MAVVASESDTTVAVVAREQAAAARARAAAAREEESAARVHLKQWAGMEKGVAVGMEEGVAVVMVREAAARETEPPGRNSRCNQSQIRKTNTRFQGLHRHSHHQTCKRMCLNTTTPAVGVVAGRAMVVAKDSGSWWIVRRSRRSPCQGSSHHTPSQGRRRRRGHLKHNLGCRRRCWHTARQQASPSRAAASRPPVSTDVAVRGWRVRVLRDA